MVRCRKRIAMELVAKVGFCVWTAALLLIIHIL